MKLFNFNNFKFSDKTSFNAWHFMRYLFKGFGYQLKRLVQNVKQQNISKDLLSGSC
jgi:hypothetical protein